MSGFKRMLQAKFNPPFETTESFAGKVVLITGATNGLGLEAAKKIAALNADKLIITARDDARGQNAKSQIESVINSSALGKTASTTEVSVLSLNMSRSDSVRAFAEEVNARFPKLDAVILNAGTMQTKWRTSPDGWEETIQVNAISTVLLALLLLPKLVATAAAASGTESSPPNLTFISSGYSRIIKPSILRKFYDSPNALEAICAKDVFPGAQPQYGVSKLLLEYSKRQIAKLPQVCTDGGEVKVVVNSACPSFCRSNLANQFETNAVMKFLVWLFSAIFGRTTEQGANTYLSALTRGVDSHGKLWKDDRYYDGGNMVETEEGKRFGKKVWDEMVQVLEKIDPKVQNVLGGR